MGSSKKIWGVCVLSEIEDNVSYGFSKHLLFKLFPSNFFCTFDHFKRIPNLIKGQSCSKLISNRQYVCMYLWNQIIFWNFLTSVNLIHWPKVVWQINCKLFYKSSSIHFLIYGPPFYAILIILNLWSLVETAEIGTLYIDMAWIRLTWLWLILNTFSKGMLVLLCVC